MHRPGSPPALDVCWLSLFAVHSSFRVQRRGLGKPGLCRLEVGFLGSPEAPLLYGPLLLYIRGMGSPEKALQAANGFGKEAVDETALEIEAFAYAIHLWESRASNIQDQQKAVVLKQKVFRERGLVLRDWNDPPCLVPANEALLAAIPEIYGYSRRTWARKKQGVWMVLGNRYEEWLALPRGVPLYVTPELKYQFGVS